MGLTWSADSVCILVRQMKAMIFYLILASKLNLGVKLELLLCSPNKWFGFVKFNVEIDKWIFR